MGGLSWWHWLIVLAVVLLLFGSKKLPEAARGLGRSMRIFKSEMKEMQKDDEPQELTAGGQPQAQQYAQPQQYVQPQAQPVQPVSQPQAQQPQQYAQPQQPAPGQPGGTVVPPQTPPPADR